MIEDELKAKAFTEGDSRRKGETVVLLSDAQGFLREAQHRIDELEKVLKAARELVAFNPRYLSLGRLRKALAALGES